MLIINVLCDGFQLTLKRAELHGIRQGSATGKTGGFRSLIKTSFRRMTGLTVRARNDIILERPLARMVLTMVLAMAMAMAVGSLSILGERSCGRRPFAQEDDLCVVDGVLLNPCDIDVLLDVCSFNGV